MTETEYVQWKLRIHKIGFQFLVKDQPKSENAIIFSCKVMILWIILSYPLEARSILDVTLNLLDAFESMTTRSV